MTRRRQDDHHAQERRRKRITTAFSAFVVFIMVGGIFAAMLYNPQQAEDRKYNGHVIGDKALSGGGSVYVIELNKNQVELQHLPALVTYVEVDPAAMTLITNAQQLALVADANATMEDLSLIDYARLQLTLGLPTPTASGMSGENSYGLPVITCAQGSPQMPVVLFTSANTTPSVTTNGSCITVSGTGRGILAAKDRILFERYGIMTNGVVTEE